LLTEEFPGRNEHQISKFEALEKRVNGYVSLLICDIYIYIYIYL
jgi:hypothetical protein